LLTLAMRLSQLAAVLIDAAPNAPIAATPANPAVAARPRPPETPDMADPSGPIEAVRPDTDDCRPLPIPVLKSASIPETVEDTLDLAEARPLSKSFASKPILAYAAPTCSPGMKISLRNSQPAIGRFLFHFLFVDCFIWQQFRKPREFFGIVDGNSEKLSRLPIVRNRALFGAHNTEGDLFEFPDG
jgi:hypothetical protein